MLIFALLVLSLADYTRLTTSCQSSYWNDQQCVPCSTYCTCSSYGGCDSISCPTGMISYQKICYKCPTGCSTCQMDSLNAFACSACSTGYQLLSRQCVALSSFTLLTTQMVTPYELYSNTIVQPTNQGTNCLYYEPETSFCKTCSNGYFLNNYNFCEVCVANCGTCSARGTCTTCSSGYYWSVTGNLTNASLEYTGNGISGYRKTSAGACLPCNYGVATCNSTTALTCLPTYYLSQSSCLSCSTGCQTCTSSASCTACVAGYFLENGSCSYCINNTPNQSTCQTCSNSTTCTLCYGSLQLLNGLCVDCPTTITGCAVCSGGPSYSCSTCANGYYAQSSTICVSCGAGVQYCSSATTPTQCIPTYILVPVSSGSSSKTCVSNVTQQCLTMNNAVSLQCLTCAPGTYLVNYQCVACNINACNSCTVSGSAPNQQLVCSSCNSTYYINAGTCVGCTYGTLTCSSTGSLTCLSQFYLNSSQCTLCPLDNCATCTSTTCLTCISGMYLYTYNGIQICNQCSLGCQTCTNNGLQCTQCLTGYYLQNNGCRLPSPYCAVPNTDGSCATCDYGFKLIKGICTPCIDFQSGFVCTYAAALLTTLYILFM